MNTQETYAHRRGGIVVLLVLLRVRLVDEEKGFSSSAVSDAAGRYVIRQVPPGTYIKLGVSQNVTYGAQCLTASTAAPIPRSP